MYKNFTFKGITVHKIITVHQQRLWWETLFESVKLTDINEKCYIYSYKLNNKVKYWKVWLKLEYSSKKSVGSYITVSDLKLKLFVTVLLYSFEILPTIGSEYSNTLEQIICRNLSVWWRKLLSPEFVNNVSWDKTAIIKNTEILTKLRYLGLKQQWAYLWYWYTYFYTNSYILAKHSPNENDLIIWKYEFSPFT